MNSIINAVSTKIKAWIRIIFRKNISGVVIYEHSFLYPARRNSADDEKISLYRLKLFIDSSFIKLKKAIEQGNKITIPITI